MKAIQIALTAAFLLGLPGLVSAQDEEEQSKEEKERQEKGIPLHPEVIDWFKTTCDSLQVAHQL